MKYRADIDGLRALAIAPVLLFHTGVPGFSGGYVGVDTFFVISGFVIAGGLKEDVYAGRFSIMRFYVKRIRRIFPALLVSLVATFVAGCFLLLPPELLDLSNSMLACAAFVSNVYFWKSSSYFAPDSSTRPLLHTWSLSVEEQYYVFIPLAIFLVFRFLKARWLWLFAPAATASFLLSVFATKYAASANFYLVPTRAWEMLLGTMLALAPLPPLKSRLLNEAVGWAGAGLILCAVFLFTEFTPFPGPAALLPCIGSAALIYSGMYQGSLANSVLSMRWAVALGQISYSVYLVHWPLTVFLRAITLEPFTLVQSAGLVVASIILGALSWRFVEQPFRHGAFAASQSFVLKFGLGTLAAFLVLGALGAATKGLPARFPQYEAKKGGDHVWNEGICFFEPAQDFRKWSPTNCRLTREGGPKVLLWGDSFAAQYVPGLRAQADKIPAEILQYTSAGCPPVLSYFSYAQPQCAAFNANAMQLIKRERIGAVVLAARWADVKRRGIEGLQQTIEALRAANVQVFVIGQSPQFTIDIRIIGYRQQAFDPERTYSWRVSFEEDLNEELMGYAKGAKFIDPIKAFCKSYRECPYRIAGKYLYSDFGHLSTYGSGLAVQSYFPANFANRGD